METAALQEEYAGVDFDSLEKDNDLRKRHSAIWLELVDREIEEFPECPECNHGKWNWGYDSVPICAFCETIPDDSLIEEIQETAHTITNSEIE